jgi:hypothetical protein
MRTTRLLALLLLGAIVGAQDAPKAKTALAKLTDPQFVDQWLAQDCFDGEQGALTREIRRRGSRLERLFLDALDQPVDYTDLERQWEKRWREARALLDKGETFGLRKAQLAKVRADSLAAFKARAKARYDKARFNAILSGLFHAGTKESLRRLTPLSQADPDDPFLNATIRAIRARQ